MPAKTILRIRRGSSDDWSSANPTLYLGELGLDTTVNLLKAGDGTTDWNSLPYISVSPEDIQDIIGSSLVGASGIGIDYRDDLDTVYVSVTGIQSSQINDFNQAVDARVTLASIGPEQIMDIVGGVSGIYGVSGIHANYRDEDDRLDIGISGVGVEQINNFSSSVSGLIPNITGISGISSSFVNNTYTLQLSDPSIQIADITDFIDGVNDRVNDLLTEGSNVQLTYTDNNDETSSLQISVTGVSLEGHTHLVNEVTNFGSGVSGLLPVTSLSEGNGIEITTAGTDFTIAVSGIPLSLINDVTASATELNYLDGSTPGTAIQNTALVTDSDNSIIAINNLTTSGNVTVGGNLIVGGTTTTVNSTVVDIGDNIVRVNASGLNTGGFEVYTGSDHKQLIWDNNNNRWQIGGDVYSSGNFIGNLQGNADTVTSGVYLSDVGTVTSTMIADNTIVDGDISPSANINVGKLSASGVTVGVTEIILGQSKTAISGLTSVAGTSMASPVYIEWAVIDGGTP